MRTNATVLMSLLAISLMGSNLYATTPTPTFQQSALDKQIHDYILSHPEVISEAVAILAERSDQAKRDSFRKEADSHRAALKGNASDVVLQPTGAKELVEFYDIQCPHCARVGPAIEALLHKHPDVRLVLKNTPIFGSISKESAVLIAYAARNGKDAGEIYRALMSAQPLSQYKIQAIANVHGISRTEFEAALQNKFYSAPYLKNLELAKALGVQGTPAFIMNGDVSAGEDIKGVELMMSASPH